MKLCHPIRNTYRGGKKIQTEELRDENKLGNKKFLKPNIQSEKIKITETNYKNTLPNTMPRLHNKGKDKTYSCRGEKQQIKANV